MQQHKSRKKAVFRHGSKDSPGNRAIGRSTHNRRHSNSSIPLADLNWNYEIAATERKEDASLNKLNKLDFQKVLEA